MLDHIREELEAEVPGAEIETEQPLQHLISHMISGVTGHIGIKIHGDDLDVLRNLAVQIQAICSDLPGVASVVIEPVQRVEEIHITPRQADLALHGLDREHVGHFVETALRGETVSTVVEGQRRFDLVLRLDEPYRTDYTALGQLRLDLPEEGGSRSEDRGSNGRAPPRRTVPLSAVADISEGLGANEINRENGRRRLVVRVNTEGGDPGRVAEEIRRRVQQRVTLPQGYTVEYSGQFESQQRATWLLAGLSVLALAGMFLVLFLLYPSVRIVLQILTALPAAFIGGVVALVATGQPLTVASMVGFISLGGIAARNGILLVSHYFHLMQHEGEGFTPKMILRGSLERLAPVLMTALTAGIALLPLVIGGHQPGREILYPVATVISGGLVTSTLCEFLIHPGLFWRFSGRDAERLAHIREREAAEVAETETPVPVIPVVGPDEPDSERITS